MENYRKYFTGEEELLFKLEQLHRKKQKLKELLDNKKEINPFVVELCGLPRTGKTVSLGKLYEFFKNGGINIEKADPEIIIYRDYINSLYLEKRNKTTLERVSNLEKGLEHLLPNISDYEKVDIIDTTNTNAMGTSIMLANTIMDNMQKKLELK